MKLNSTVHTSCNPCEKFCLICTYNYMYLENSINHNFIRYAVYTCKYV